MGDPTGLPHGISPLDEPETLDAAPPYADILHLLTPERILTEVLALAREAEPGFDQAPIERTFGDVLDLFSGSYPGYRACNTPYHNQDHTMGVVLATARILHGALLEGQPLVRDGFKAAILAALLHDVGYIQTADDLEGSGAKHTLTHVRRSVEFTRIYARARAWSPELGDNCESLIWCTDLSLDFQDILFPEQGMTLPGQAVGSADLAAQMADDLYIDKIPTLWAEFEEGGVKEFPDAYDLFRKTLGFARFAEYRMKHHLGDVCRFLPAHFAARHALGPRDLYAEYRNKNMDYLSQILKTHGRNFADGLRTRARKGTGIGDP